MPRFRFTPFIPFNISCINKSSFFNFHLPFTKTTYSNKNSRILITFNTTKIAHITRFFFIFFEAFICLYSQSSSYTTQIFSVFPIILNSFLIPFTLYNSQIDLSAKIKIVTSPIHSTVNNAFIVLGVDIE